MPVHDWSRVAAGIFHHPLYLEPDGYVLVPLESTYGRAFDALPKRWRSVVEA